MKGFVENLAVKIISFFLCIVLVFFIFASVLGVYVMIKSDVYYDGGDELISSIYGSYSDKHHYVVEDYLHDKYSSKGAYDNEFYNERLSSDNTNYRFTAVDENGMVLESNISPGEKLVRTRTANIRVFIAEEGTVNWHYKSFEHGENIDVSYYITQFEQENGVGVIGYEIDSDPSRVLLKLEYTVGEHRDVTITSSVLKEPTKKDILYFSLNLADFAISIRESIFVYAVIAFLVLLFLVIILLCGAGHKKGHEGIYISKFNKIPFDLYVFINGLIAYLAVEIFCELSYGDLGVLLGFCLVVPLFTAMALGLSLTFAARIKADGWYKNTVIYFVLTWLFKGIKALFKGVVYIISKMLLLYKALFAILVISFLEFLFIIMGMEDYVWFWIVEKIVLVPSLMYIVLCMRKLQTSARKIAKGETDYKTDTKYMIFDFKEHGETLNGISDGLSIAVSERVKSERMKAELITNVSHDIKTPLTSVINYVDLLKREGLESENAQEYLSVIEKHSIRLKRLIEDLVEASKASTGNVKMNFEKTDIVVLLNQAIGEFEEKLKEKQLQLVVDNNAEEITVNADGRHLWRVFDNLLNNICKYAMPNTRVYLSAEYVDNRAVITFRNISKEPLNIMPSELTERFVRGDKSRNTEGSGLGLSIAKSLTELQGGQFDIQIDGDLFKVTIII